MHQLACQIKTVSAKSELYKRKKKKKKDSCACVRINDEIVFCFFVSLSEASICIKILLDIFVARNVLKALYKENNGSLARIKFRSFSVAHTYVYLYKYKCLYRFFFASGSLDPSNVIFGHRRFSEPSIFVRELLRLRIRSKYQLSCDSAFRSSSRVSDLREIHSCPEVKRTKQNSTYSQCLQGLRRGKTDQGTTKTFLLVNLDQFPNFKPSFKFRSLFK